MEIRDGSPTTDGDSGEDEKEVAGQEEEDTVEISPGCRFPPRQGMRKRKQTYHMGDFWDLPLQTVPLEATSWMGLALAGKGETAPSELRHPPQKKRMRWKKPEGSIPLLLEGRRGGHEHLEKESGLGPSAELEEGGNVLEENRVGEELKFEEEEEEGDSYHERGDEEGGDTAGDEDCTLKGEADQKDHILKRENVEEPEEPVLLHYAPNIDEVIDFEDYQETVEEREDDSDYQEEELEEEEEEEEYKPRNPRRKPGCRRPQLKRKPVWNDPVDEPAVKLDPNATELYMMRVDDYMVAEPTKNRDSANPNVEEGMLEFETKGAVEKQESDKACGDDGQATEGDKTDIKNQVQVENHWGMLDRRLYGCPYCSFVNHKKRWISHLKKSHTDKKIMFCQKNRLCFAPFQSQEMLDKHMVQVHMPQRKCPKCDKVFRYPGGLRTHMNTHLDDDDENKKKIICQYCGKKFNSKAGIQHHVANHHVINLRHACTWEGCDRKFYTPNELAIHMRRHTGERPFVCSYCGDSYTSSASLGVHERAVHTGKAATKQRKSRSRPSDGTQRVKCEVCNKWVRQKTMNYHMRKHMGLKGKEPTVTKMSCSVCGKEFPSKRDVERHEAIHFGDKKHACQYCGKAFVQKANMQAHERIHTGEKPYACKYCPERFVQGTRRNHHQASCRHRPLPGMEPKEDDEPKRRKRGPKQKEEEGEQPQQVAAGSTMHEEDQKPSPDQLQSPPPQQVLPHHLAQVGSPMESGDAESVVLHRQQQQHQMAVYHHHFLQHHHQAR